MEWQDLPELRHDKVKLKANLEVFYNGWHQPIELPNYVSQQELLKVCVQGANKYDKETRLAISSIAKASNPTNSNQT